MDLLEVSEAIKNVANMLKDLVLDDTLSAEDAKLLGPVIVEAIVKNDYIKAVYIVDE